MAGFISDGYRVFAISHPNQRFLHPNQRFFQTVLVGRQSSELAGGKSMRRVMAVFGRLAIRRYS